MPTCRSAHRYGMGILIAVAAAAGSWAVEAAPTDAEGSASPIVERPAPRDARATALAWADAWSRQSADDYFSFYSQTFQPRNAASRTAWQAERRERIERPAWIEVTLEKIQVMVKNDHTEVTFVQHYRSDGFRDAVRKGLVLVWERERWKIRSEDVLPDPPADP